MISHPPGFLAKIWPLAKIAEPASGSNSLVHFRISASQKTSQWLQNHFTTSKSAKAALK
tara:strand:+ start:253 stop:429 length:177 start_codon:yes stop_codon:yes gene_type:complete